MYHAHFGLERGLFGEGIAADAAVFRSPKHDQLIAHFKLAFGSPSSSVVLRGPAGVGKTTLTAAALRATGTRLALAWINGNATNAAELLELILVELGIGTLNTTRIERLQLWRQFQAETRATDSRLFVVVERTEDLSAEVLHALDQLTAPDAAGNPGANLVLLGNDGIDAHLAVPLLDSLRQRIRLRAELAPFTEAELQDYLRHQVACAGGHYDHVLAPGAVAALYRYSRGIARLANNLCEAALDIASAQGQQLLTAGLVAKTAVSVLGLTEPAPLLRPAEPAPHVRAAAIGGATVPPAVRPTPEPTVSPGPLPASEPRVLASPVRPATAEIEASPARTTTAATTPAPPRTLSADPARVTPASVPLTATAPPTPSPAPLVPVMRAPAPASVAPAPATAPVATAKREPVEFEYDGGATDVTDVALVDFPVLTDAVEGPDPAAKSTAAPANIAPAAVTAPAPRAAAPAQAATSTLAPAASPPAPKPASRVETAYTAARPAPKPAVGPTPAPAPAQARAPSPPAPVPATAKPSPPRPPPAAADPDEDVLRQTQTMRAISVAKSIDDISELDAETLFSDAELDLVAAALASAEVWTADDAPTATPVSAPAPTPAPPKTQPTQAASPVAAEDPFAFFGLGDDAPLELIDDSVQSPNDQTRKTASR